METTLRLAEELDRRIEEALKPLPPLQPSKSPVTALTIPTPKEFTDFYGDYVMYKTSLQCEISDSIITIKNNTPNARTLQIGLYAVVELLADKYNQPVSQFYMHGATHSPLPDFDNIHTQLKETMSWIETCFSNLLEYSDPRVIKMCKDYYNSMSTPLVLRLRFYEFEKSLISVKIDEAIQEGLKEKDEKVRQFEREYAEKFETVKLNFGTQLNEAKKAVERYKWIAKDLQDDLEAVQSKFASIKDETSNTSQKLTDAESRLEELERKYSDTKLRCDKMERDLKRFTEQPWAMGSTSTLESPTFINIVTGEVVTYPPIDEFKKEWKPTGKEGEHYVYKKGNDTKKIPESLEFKFNDLIKELYRETEVDNKSNPVITKSKSVKKKLSENDERVLDAISKSKDGLSQTDTANVVKVSQKHISKHINKLEDFDLIYHKEVEVDGRKTTKYFVKK